MLWLKKECTEILIDVLNTQGVVIEIPSFFSNIRYPPVNNIFPGASTVILSIIKKAQTYTKSGKIRESDSLFSQKSYISRTDLRILYVMNLKQATHNRRNDKYSYLNRHLMK